LSELFTRVVLSRPVAIRLYCASASPLVGPLVRRFCDWIDLTFEMDETSAITEPTT
jgi:hypothetical protein